MQFGKSRNFLSATRPCSLFRLRACFLFWMFAVAFSPAQQSCTPRPLGMVGWWPGDGNANDISGNGNNGAFFNEQFTPTDCVPNASGCGKVRQAFSFNGLNAVEIPDSGTLHFGTGDITIEAWINAPAGDTFRTFVGKERQSFPFASVIFRLAPSGHLQFAVK